MAPSRSPGLPLLPAEVIIRSEHQEEAQDGAEDHNVSRQDESTCPPCDLRTHTHTHTEI